MGRATGSQAAPIAAPDASAIFGFRDALAYIGAMRRLKRPAGDGDR